MFVPQEVDPRERLPTPTVGDERALLLWQLQYLRETLEIKCAGLSADALARRAIPPSTMSLLGIVRHSAEVERRWFRRWMVGQDASPYFYSEADTEGDFEGAVADDDVVARSFQVWRDECEFADRFISDEAVSLNHIGQVEYYGPLSLREAIVHVIQEYARHVGHADLFREVIDGRIGI